MKRSIQTTVTLVLLLAGPALAADFPLPQKRLLLKSSSVGVLSKARSSTIPLPAIPPNASGGQVRVCTDTDPVGVVFPLPSSDWDGFGSSTTPGWRYDNPNPDPGPGECLNVLLKKDSFIKIRCRATGITQPATGRIHQRIRIGSNDYCTDCATDGSAGTVRQNTGQRTVITNCPAPASCPCSASPSGAFLEAAALF